jgi:hypothetical protein
MYLNSRFMFDLQHYRAGDGPGLALHALPMAQSKWDWLTMVEMMGIRNTSELIKKFEESYSSPMSRRPEMLSSGLYRIRIGPPCLAV